MEKDRKYSWLIRYPARFFQDQEHVESTRQHWQGIVGFAITTIFDPAEQSYNFVIDDTKPVKNETRINLPPSV